MGERHTKAVKGLEKIAKEVYDDFTSDAITMLMRTRDAGGLAAAKPLAHVPDTVWHYSSGTSNIVARALRRAIGDDDAYWRLPYERLFGPLGMASAVIETDPSGSFVGSSYSHASARDWARFGQLYLQDGVWAGERILPEGWVKYSTTPAPKAPKGEYGAYWWLNAGNPVGSTNRYYPSLPSDLYWAWGYEGQNVIVIPSRDLVLVHLGKSLPPSLTWSPENFVAGILGAIKR